MGKRKGDITLSDRRIYTNDRPGVRKGILAFVDLHLLIYRLYSLENATISYWRASAPLRTENREANVERQPIRRMHSLIRFMSVQLQSEVEISNAA